MPDSIVSPGQFKPPSGKPQQGTLFNMKPTDEHRWPAGYTPERKEAVSSALSDVHVSAHELPREGDLFMAAKTYYTPDPEIEHRGTWARPLKEIWAAQETHGRSVVTDAIARSTIPIKDLANMPTIHAEDIGEHAAGDYSHPEFGPSTSTRWDRGKSVPDPESESRGRIRMNTGPDARSTRAGAEKTLIHELGHHVDYQNDPEAFKDDPRNPSAGREGYAEGYAAKHHVPRRNAPDPSYAEHASYKQFHGDPEFERKFTEASGQTVKEATGQIEPPPVLGGRQWQQRLFERNVHSVETQTQRDYGQWSLRTASGEDLGPGERSGAGVPPLEERIRPGLGMNAEELTHAYAATYEYGRENGDRSVPAEAAVQKFNKLVDKGKIQNAGKIR